MSKEKTVFPSYNQQIFSQECCGNNDSKGAIVNMFRNTRIQVQHKYECH